MADFTVNKFRVVLLGASSTVGELVGWVELLNNTTPTGYIYLHNRADNATLPPDSLSSGGTYVVMHQRVKYLDSLLTILKGPKPLTISINNGASILFTTASSFLAADEVSDIASAPPDKSVLQDILAASLSDSTATQPVGPADSVFTAAAETIQGVVSGLDVQKQQQGFKVFAFITDLGGSETQVVTRDQRFQTVLEQASGNVTQIQDHKPPVELEYRLFNRENVVSRIRFLDR